MSSFQLVGSVETSRDGLPLSKWWGRLWRALWGQGSPFLNPVVGWYTVEKGHASASPSSFTADSRLECEDRLVCSLVNTRVYVHVLTLHLNLPVSLERRPGAPHSFLCILVWFFSWLFKSCGQSNRTAVFRRQQENYCRCWLEGWLIWGEGVAAPLGCSMSDIFLFN